MNSKTKKITTIGMLCAITYVIMAVGRIPVVLFLKALSQQMVDF